MKHVAAHRSRRLSLLVAFGLFGTPACGLVLGVGEPTFADDPLDGSSTNDAPATPPLEDVAAETHVGGDAADAAIGDSSGDSASACTTSPCARMIAAGGNVTCAGFDDGKVRCWGENNTGAVGGPQNGTYPVPVVVPLAKSATALATLGWGHTSDNGLSCAAHADGVSCWGSDKASALGRGDASSGALFVPQPAAVVGAGAADEVGVSGYGQACARTGGSLVCWGFRLGRDAGAASSAEPWPLPQAATHVRMGRSMACATLVGGRLACWGQLFNGRDWWKVDGGGLGAQPLDPSRTVNGFDNVEDVSLGSEHICALSQGRVLCIGRNDNGQLGRGMTEAQTITAAPVNGLPGAAVVIGGGGNHTCAALADGSVWCWGRNSGSKEERGQLGVGGIPYVPSPVRVPGLPSEAVAQIRGGYSHTCMLTRGGSVYCWGGNDKGQLGVGSTAGGSHPTPQRILF